MSTYTYSSLCVSEGFWEDGLAIASPVNSCMVASPISPVVCDPFLGVLVSLTYIVYNYCVVICLVPHMYIMSIVTAIYEHVRQSVCQ